MYSFLPSHYGSRCILTAWRKVSVHPCKEAGMPSYSASRLKGAVKKSLCGVPLKKGESTRPLAPQRDREVRMKLPVILPFRQTAKKEEKGVIPPSSPRSYPYRHQEGRIDVVHHLVVHHVNEEEKKEEKKKSQSWVVLFNPWLWLFVITALGMILQSL